MGTGRGVGDVKASERAPIARLCRIAGQLGAEILLVSDREFTERVGLAPKASTAAFDGFVQIDHPTLKPSVSKAPFADGLALEWTDKRVIAARRYAQTVHLIHELAHVLVGGDPRTPLLNDEWSFLGWELVVARMLGRLRTWRARFHGYGVLNDYPHRNAPGRWASTIGDLSDAAFRDTMRERMLAARADGMLSRTFQPLSLR